MILSTYDDDDEDAYDDDGDNDNDDGCVDDDDGDIRDADSRDDECDCFIGRSKSLIDIINLDIGNCGNILAK